jgi:hypothetical protein
MLEKSPYRKITLSILSHHKSGFLSLAAKSIANCYIWPGKESSIHPHI